MSHSINSIFHLRNCFFYDESRFTGITFFLPLNTKMTDLHFELAAFGCNKGSLLASHNKRSIPFLPLNTKMTLLLFEQTPFGCK